MDDECTCTDVDFITSYEGHEMLPVLLRLLVQGRPVAVAEIARATGRDPAEVESLLRAQPGTDWDDTGALVGFALTLQETPYRFIVDGRVLYTWCATDTLFFPVVLGVSATVESICPATGQTIRIEVSPMSVVAVEPAEAVVSQLHARGEVEDIRASVCDHGHFFASPDAARSWLAEHPGGRVVGVRQAFATSRAGCDQLGWVASGTGP